MISDPETEDMVEVDFSASGPLTGADRTVMSIAGGLNQMAETFRAVAPTQTTPVATERALHAATVLDELADEAWNLVGSGTTPGAQFALRQLGRSTALAVAALRRGASPEFVAEAMGGYFSNLHSVLDRLEATAERRLLVAFAAFRASLQLAQLEVAQPGLRALPQRSLQSTRRVGGPVELGSADLYRNVHALIAAALAPPTFLPNDDPHSLGGMVQSRAS
jgi:hypothetical protein